MTKLHFDCLDMGNLTVTLVRAKNLIAADRGGVSDPYIVFKLNGKEVHKSEVIKKTLNPEYNETFVQPIVSVVCLPGLQYLHALALTLVHFF